MTQSSPLRIYLIVTLLAGCALAGDWTGFRGPDAQGVSNETGLPLTWSETENLAWKTVLPGPGSSCPIVLDNKVYLTCYSGYGLDRDHPGDPNGLKRHLLCIDATEGTVLWNTAVPALPSEEPYKGMFREHGYASSTPVTDGERIYVFFGKSGVLAYDLQGRPLWQTPVGADSDSKHWGSATSPVLYKNMVIVNAWDESKALYALDKTNGQRIWTKDLSKTGLTFATPVLAGAGAGRMELIMTLPSEVWGLNPDSGETLWSVRTHMTELICPTPLVVDNVVYVHGGGLKSSGSLALRCGGRGDVTDSHVLWTSKEVTSPPAPVKQDGFLYWVDGGGTACCMDATTGTLRYQEKLPVQGRFAAYASPIAAEGKIYAVTRKHGTFVLPAQPEFRIIAHNRFGSDDSDFNGSPVISNGRVLLRSDRALYCVTKTVDPFMGDWKGRGETDMGEAFEFVGQVIALGDNQYRMNFLEEFDSAYLDPMYVLNGELKGDTFRYTTEGGEYTGEIILAGPRARGTYKGSEGGRFEMQRVERLSPTLGAAAPKDAIVLFDGTNLDQWERMTGAVGLIDLAQIVGGDNAVAYLGTLFQTDGDQQAVLEIGSDDGVKVWLNGEVVHTNNANRGVTPGQDKITVNLVDGQNTLMFKVTNGAGGWGACARLANSNGKTLATISEAVEENGEWTVTKEFLKENQGFLTVWWVCGPYRAEGKAGTDLMDVEFEPEYLGRDAPWQLVERQQAPKDPRWILKDGAMQVRDGNIATKRRTFTDFTLHVEFKTPFMPKARGQGRGNSGVYLQNRYEIQVLDSYGLEGLDNECGGIYQVGRPHVNMCAPPEQWQTYDIDFTAAKMVNGQQSPAVVTVIHSGITIHNQLKIPRETGGAMDTHLLQPGGIYLQDHSNPVQYRNIWIAPK